MKAGVRMQIAVVTGASSGLGREFVRQISRKEKLDAIWVIARREDRLKELAENSAVPVWPLPLDLTKPESISTVRGCLRARKPDVRILVNAAGFGKIGTYPQISEQDSGRMIDLNCKALVAVTSALIPYMRRGARILEISSVASFQPLPGLNIYAATKAFVSSYSRALRWEMFGKGIHVTAVCPYWIGDTEFIPVAKDSAGSRAVRHFPLVSHAKTVAGFALWASRLNLPVATPGLLSSFIRLASKFIPHEIVIPIWEALRRI
jgi:hypothetical protein